MKIGFYGDSFCSSAKPGTWVNKISQEFAAEITSLGQAGSSIWDVLLIQFFESHGHHAQQSDYLVEPNWNELPDILVFCWTDSDRLFNQQIRNITLSSISNTDSKDPIIVSAKLYYENLYDKLKHDFEYCAILDYFDRHILKKISEKRKIIHLWSFGRMGDNEVVYAHKWQHGVEIRPPLYSITKHEQENYNISEKAPNHIGLEAHNQMLSDCVVNAIKNYQSGKIFEYKIS